MTAFVSIAGALAPVFALVISGYIMGRWSFPSSTFWPGAERLTYYVLFPVLLVVKISSASLPAGELGNVISVLVLLLLLGCGLILLLGKLVESDPRLLSSMFQGGIRFNTYVGLAAVSALLGDSGMVWAAVFLVLMIPLVNIASILCFSLLQTTAATQQPLERRAQLPSLLLNVIKNPLIIACLVGAALNLLQLSITPPLLSLLELIAAMALPLGLLAVGVGLDISVLRRGGYSLWLTTLFKLAIYPAIFLLLTLAIEIPTQARLAILLFTLLPTAPSAYILSKQLNGDASLMAAIITLQTLVAMISMPLMLMWLI